MTKTPANIVLITSDQHTRAAVGCFGNTSIETPALDALAAAGTIFRHAYCTSPICVPARASLATGRYVHQLGTWDNAAPYSGKQAASWGHRISRQGHAVVTVGKLHYSSEHDRTGFDDQRLPMHVVPGGGVPGLLREAMPVSTRSREHVTDAGPGMSEYQRYDRNIAEVAAAWLRDEAPQQDQPWAMHVSFVSPHFPLKAPVEYYERYRARSLDLPINFQQERWADHPAAQMHRRLQDLDTPLDVEAIRRAMAAYYALVSFVDDQVATVVQALDDSGQRGGTRIIYMSDHGEMLGDRGLWWKSTMYEGALAVPFIAQGPGVPRGAVCETPISHVDVFPSIVDCVGAALDAEDADLPGRSIWPLARGPRLARTVFSEYHAVYSANASFAVVFVDGRYKLIYHVGHRAELFDLKEDPDELHDLSAEPEHAATLARCDQALRSIVDPEETDALAKASQRARLRSLGGAPAAESVRFTYTPPPTEQGSP